MSDTPKRFRWGRLVLALSLALNLAVIGIVIGASWRFGGEQDRRPGRSAGAFAAPYVFALPRADRQALRAELQARAPKDRRGARRAQYEAVLAALRADPFDRQAVATALRSQKDATIAGQRAAEEAWLARIETMDAETRAAYADRVEKIVNRRRSRKR